MKYKALVPGLLAAILLIGCGGGDVDLPRPDSKLPDYVMLVTNDPAPQPSQDKVTFEVNWSAADLNNQTSILEEEGLPVVLFAILQNGTTINYTTTTYPAEIPGVQDPYSATSTFDVSDEQYDEYCGEEVTVFSAINPTQEEAPEGVQVRDPIPEEDRFDLPVDWGDTHQNTVTVTCG